MGFLFGIIFYFEHCEDAAVECWLAPTKLGFYVSFELSISAGTRVLGLIKFGRNTFDGNNNDFSAQITLYDASMKRKSVARFFCLCFGETMENWMWNPLGYHGYCGCFHHLHLNAMSNFNTFSCACSYELFSSCCFSSAAIAQRFINGRGTFLSDPWMFAILLLQWTIVMMKSGMRSNALQCACIAYTGHIIIMTRGSRNLLVAETL